MKRIVLLCCVLMAVAVTLSATAPPSITELETPYLALRQSVRFGGVQYAAGVVNYGPVGTPIVIHGVNFGSAGSVVFHGTATPVPYSTGDPTSISVSVPNGATTGTIVVTANALNSNAVPFIVTVGNYSASCSQTPLPPPAPVIASLTPSSGPVGTSVTITGSNFGATQGASTVAVAGLAATVVSWKATSIIIWVPNSTPTGSLAPVTVTVANQPSNAVGFNVPTVPTPDPNCTLTQ